MDTKTRSLFSLAALAAFACASLATAQQPAGSTPAAQPANPQKVEQKAGPQKPVPLKQAQTSQNPPPNLQRPQPLQPAANDVPKPTVQLKEGEVPAVKFDTPVYDFGRVRAGQEVMHDFWFTNTGTGPLEILKVKPSCGCTTAGEHDRIVQPGQTGKIPIKLNIGQSAGPVAKTVMVATNAATEGQVTLQIKGEVWQPIQATPPSASFGRLTAEEAQKVLERKLTIVNNTDETANLTDIKCTTPQFKATVATLEPGKKFEMTVSIVAPLKPGVASGSIEVATGMKETPKLTIPASAFVTADVEVTPNQLTLPTSRTDKLQRQFFVRNNSKNPIKISDLKASNEKLALAIVETQPIGMAYRITMDIPADYQPAEGGDKVTFKTDNPTMPEVSVPIFAARTPGEVASQFQRPPQSVGGTAAPLSPAQVLQMKTEERKQAQEAAKAPAPQAGQPAAGQPQTPAANGGAPAEKK